MTKSEKEKKSISAGICVVGGGIAGLTAAIEAAEVGHDVVIIEKQPYLGGRVAAMTSYFPKLCPPTCGLEINFRRIRQNPRIRFFTLAEVISVDGKQGDYTVKVRQNPRYVDEKCTACGDCEKACTIERPNDFNYDIDKTKAVYLPHSMAFPMRYVVDPAHAKDEGMKAAVDACSYDAIDLDMQEEVFEVKVGSLVWATGWKPYDAARIENLGYGRYPNVISNVVMERLAAPNGPKSGKIVRPSDEKEVTSVAFAQCAGSRDENHLPYCSAVCCMASLKQAAYVRERYPDAAIHIFYIDIRTPGRLEDFYTKMQEDEKIFFHRGKVAKVTERPDTKNLVVEAENTLTGGITEMEVDLVVLATGMVPNCSDAPPPMDAARDENGFLVAGSDGPIGVGTALRPFDVAGSVQSATGASLDAIQALARE